MINIDYDVPIDDDDIIGWKSDRGWVYLTLLGVRAPQNKSTNRNFKGVVKKIVIDDFDESTQLAILINKPILGYDIINSKGTPGTIVFIHTEMKKSEVANLKQHIEKQGSSVFNVAKSSGFPKYNTNFKNAFDEARKEFTKERFFRYLNTRNVRGFRREKTDWYPGSGKDIPQLNNFVYNNKSQIKHFDKDEILNNGVVGTRGAINFLQSLRDMLAGSSKSSVNVTVKWDGAPAIFAGINPENGQFFVGTKGVFNKNAKINYSHDDIDRNHPSSGLNQKLKVALTELSKLGIKDVLQGDMMFTLSLIHI